MEEEQRSEFDRMFDNISIVSRNRLEQREKRWW